MMKTFTAMTLAAAALGAAAAPASAETVTVSLAGKSPAVALRVIEQAARTACYGDRANDIYSVYMSTGCVAETVEATVAKIGDPTLAKYVAARKEFLVASR